MHSLVVFNIYLLVGDDWQHMAHCWYPNCILGAREAEIDKLLRV